MKLWIQRHLLEITIVLSIIAVLYIGISALVSLDKKNTEKWGINLKFAYTAGAEGRCLGVPATSNPYRGSTSMKYEWIKGWAEAECIDGKVVLEEEGD